jgi:hypothetical protein
MPDITLSKKYLHELKALHTEYQEKRITDEEFSQRIDELREQEAKLHEPMGRVLLMQQLENAEKEIEHEVEEELQQKRREREAEEREKRVEHTRQIQKQQRERETEAQKALQERRRREIERDSYRNAIDDYVNRLEDKARRRQNWYNVLQIVLLVFSAGTATMASMEVVPRWVVSITGLVATIAGGLLTTFKIQERIYANRKAVAEVRLETQKYDYHIDEYKNMDTEGAFIKFSRSITAIQGQEMLQEVEFWNPRKEEKKEEKITQTNLQEDKKDEESDEIPEKLPQEEKLSDSES